MGKYCLFCGNSLEDEDVICPKCGKTQIEWSPSRTFSIDSEMPSSHRDSENTGNCNDRTETVQNGCRTDSNRMDQGNIYRKPEFGNEDGGKDGDGPRILLLGIMIGVIATLVSTFLIFGLNSIREGGDGNNVNSVGKKISVESSEADQSAESESASTLTVTPTSSPTLTPTPTFTPTPPPMPTPTPTEVPLPIAVPEIAQEPASSMEPFYGIWCHADKSESEVEKYARQLRDAGFNAQVFFTCDWSNLNSEPWYAVSAGIYSSEEAAENALQSVKNVYGDAYVKYSGTYQGRS